MKITEIEQATIEEMIAFIEPNWKAFLASVSQRGNDQAEIEQGFEDIQNKLYQ